ncbi:hypothetical protein BDR05DRAFT_942931 [Suillus weaverae]|nr:hypothetical protein BDR05DRAFT_942931 [Suillus weaverae]
MPSISTNGVEEMKPVYCLTSITESSKKLIIRFSDLQEFEIPQIPTSKVPRVKELTIIRYNNNVCTLFAQSVGASEKARIRYHIRSMSEWRSGHARPSSDRDLPEYSGTPVKPGQGSTPVQRYNKDDAYRRIPSLQPHYRRASPGGNDGADWFTFATALQVPRDCHQTAPIELG